MTPNWANTISTWTCFLKNSFCKVRTFTILDLSSKWVVPALEEIWCQIVISERFLMSFSGQYIATRNTYLYMIGFSVDSVLKSSNEIDIWIKFTQNWDFPHSDLAQWSPEKELLMQSFLSWYLMEIFSERCTALSTLRFFKVYYYHY